MAMTEVRERVTDRLRHNFILDLYRSPVGKKYAMALSGIVLLGFVIAHMIGNLHLYEGSEKMAEYAEFLRDFGEPVAPRTLVLWLFLRLPLALAFAVHIHAAYSLTYVNATARPDKYQQPREWLAANYASRTMRWSGTIVLLFLLWHLADLTWGWAFVNPEWQLGMPYENVVASLSRVGVAALYIVANIALGFHIFHGAWSLFQSIGVNHPRFNRWRRWLAQGLATIVVVGNLSFPISVVTGLVS